MIIEKIRIESFGSLENRDFEFCEGVNIIEGANESGKSTLAAFIKFIFYGLASKAKDGGISAREKYVSWKTGSAAGSLILNVGDERYRIDRALMSVGQTSENGEKKTTYREGVGIVNLSNNSPIKVKEEPGEYFFGVDADVFARTAFVSQLDGARIEGEKMTQAIENILFSADENVNVQKAIKKLEASRIALLHKNAKGGKIYEFEAARAELEAKLESARRINADILAKESSLEDAKARLVNVEKNRDTLSRGIKSFENATMLTLFDRQRQLEKMSADYKEKENELSERYAKDGFVPDKEYVGLLYSKGEKRKAAEEKLALVKGRVDDAAMGIEEIKCALPENSDWQTSEHNAHKAAGVKKGFTLLGVIFGVIALLMIGGGILVRSLLTPGDVGVTVMLAAIFPVVISVIALVLAGVKSAQLKKIYLGFGVTSRSEFEEVIENAKNTAEKLSAAEVNLSLVRAELEVAETEYKAAEEEFAQLAHRWNSGAEPGDVIKSAEEAVQEGEKISADSAKTDELLSALKIQLSPYSEDELRASSDSTDTGVEVNGENVSEKRRELDFLTAQGKANETQIHELEKELAALRPQCENPARIAEKITLIKAYIDEYTKKHAAYVLAAEKILEAGDGMRENISPKLAEYTCKLMSGVTGGKYREIGVDSELNVSVNTGGTSRKLDFLSAGTQDAAYVSLRLALINTLFRKTSPAVIFDESFSRLDADRLGGMMKLAETLSSGGVQSILLTSGPREAEVMKTVGDFNVILMD